MAIMSLLRRAGQSSPNQFKMVIGKVQHQSVRGGHDRVLEIHPTTYTWYKFKDNFHFWVIVAFIPLSTLSAYHNLRYGRSILTETPEGYEPMFYEYEKHPVTRFICWMTDNHPRYNFERRLDAINYHAEKQMLRCIEKQVRAVMKVRGDHKSWYYQPIWEARGDRMRRYRIDQVAPREGIMDSHFHLSGNLESARAPNEPASRSLATNRGGGESFASDQE